MQLLVCQSKRLAEYE
uniref:Uncharacterized protein n=1 Tax=Lepeophtheirus salmonis TaxID=72036 RepID=A0A0K2V1B6_LEPSM